MYTVAGKWRGAGGWGAVMCIPIRGGASFAPGWQRKKPRPMQRRVYWLPLLLLRLSMAVLGHSLRPRLPCGSPACASCWGVLMKSPPSLPVQAWVPTPHAGLPHPHHCLCRPGCPLLLTPGAARASAGGGLCGGRCLGQGRAGRRHVPELPARAQRHVPRRYQGAAQHVQRRRLADQRPAPLL